MKNREKRQDDSLLVDDLEAFEEWEEGEAPGAQAANAPATPAKGPKGEAAAGESKRREAPKAEGPITAGDPAETEASASLSEGLLDLAPDVPVNLVAVIGKTTTDVGALLKCRVGQVIDLGRPPGEVVDLVANGRLIARGELVEMDGKMGVRILKMVR